MWLCNFVEVYDCFELNGAIYVFLLAGWMRFGDSEGKWDFIFVFLA